MRCWDLVLALVPTGSELRKIWPLPGPDAAASLLLSWPMGQINTWPSLTFLGGATKSEPSLLLFRLLGVESWTKVSQLDFHFFSSPLNILKSGIFQWPVTRIDALLAPNYR